MNALFSRYGPIYDLYINQDLRFGRVTYAADEIDSSEEIMFRTDPEKYILEMERTSIPSSHLLQHGGTRCMDAFNHKDDMHMMDGPFQSHVMMDDTSTSRQEKLKFRVTHMFAMNDVPKVMVSEIHVHIVYHVLTCMWRLIGMTSDPGVLSCVFSCF